MPSLRINQRIYTIPSRFAPGHICSAEDAEVLTRAYVDAVRKKADVEGWATAGDCAQKLWDHALGFQWKLRQRSHAKDRLEELALELAQGADPAGPEVLARAAEKFELEQALAQEALAELLGADDGG